MIVDIRAALYMRESTWWLNKPGCPETGGRANCKLTTDNLHWVKPLRHVLHAYWPCTTRTCKHSYVVPPPYSVQFRFRTTRSGRPLAAKNKGLTGRNYSQTAFSQPVATVLHTALGINSYYSVYIVFIISQFSSVYFNFQWFVVNC